MSRADWLSLLFVIVMIVMAGYLNYGHVHGWWNWKTDSIVSK